MARWVGAVVDGEVGGGAYPRISVAGAWPLIGRREELALIAEARHRGTSGVVLSGAPGVGKTRLAAEATSEAAADGWAIVALRATPGMAMLPMAAFAPLVPAAAGRSTAELVDAADAALTDQAEGRPLLVSIDDAHLLDEVSAGFVHRLAATGRAFVVVTARAEETRPEALTALWKDGLADRIELQPLSQHETGSLIELLLEGEVDPSTRHRIWVETDGNALFVREVVLAAVQSGAMNRRDGVWHRTGVAVANSRLREVIEERLRRLDGDERTTLEVLALAGTVAVDVVVQLAGTDAVAALERVRLIVVERHGRRIEATVAHPLYAEVLREAIPRLRARAILRQLADAVEARGAGQPTDRMRVAIWRLEHGASVDPVTLVEASDVAQWSVAATLIDRFQEALTIGAAAGQLPADRLAPWRSGAGDPELAMRLARAAWDANGGATAGAAFAMMLVWSGRPDEAAEVMADIDPEPLAPNERLAVARARDTLLFWGLNRPDEAQAVLLEAEAALEGEADDSLRREAVRARAGNYLNVGQPAAALAAAESIVIPGASDLITLRAAATAAASLALLGRTAEAIELVDKNLPFAMAAADESALVMAELLFARVAALVRAGRLGEAEMLAEAAYQIALASESVEGAAIFGTAIGRVALIQGRPATAARRFREAGSLFAERDPFCYRRWALAGLSTALAVVGDHAGAAEALATAAALRTIPRFYETDFGIAEHAALRLAGKPVEAAAAARQAARAAAAAGLVGDEAMLLHAIATTYGGERRDADEIEARLVSLAATADGVLVPALADHVAALRLRDADALDKVSTRFEEMGAILVAAEAAAHAADVRNARGTKRAVQAATRRATDLAARCEGARVAVLERLAAPRGLTDREFEIARLAGAGESSRAIAERLVVSVRTVDSHLYRVFAKLGVANRAQLADALGAGA